MGCSVVIGQGVVTDVGSNVVAGWQCDSFLGAVRRPLGAVWCLWGIAGSVLAEGSMVPADIVVF